jgi:membrane associated rhomboid family serine protease
MLGSSDQSRAQRGDGSPRLSLGDWLSRYGSVVQVLLWTNVSVFFIQLLASAFRFNIGAANAVEWALALNLGRLLHGCIWQPFTYMFLHDLNSLFHILFNLLWLWFFGREVEFYIGPKYFTRLYLWGGLVGAALWIPFHLDGSYMLLGASAAVLACVIAFATLFPEREITLLIFFVLPVSIKAKYLAMVAVALDVVPLLTGTDTRVAHLAHLGGAFMGYLYIKNLGYGATPRWLILARNAAGKLRPRRRPPPRDMSPDEFMREVVDPILDKIAREGMQSLTRKERKILESAKDQMQNRRR